MEQSNVPTKNPGKGMGLAGFIIGLVALVVGLGIYVICVAAALLGGGMGLAIFWTVLSAVAVLLSFMGMQKSKAAGHKPGLSMGGLIVGILALLLSLYTIYSVHVVHSAVGTGIEDFKNAMDSVKTIIDTTVGQ